MTCCFCGCSERVTKYDGLAYNNPTAYICSSCVRNAFYCTSCLKVHTVKAVVSGHVLCPDCAATKVFCVTCGIETTALNEDKDCAACAAKKKPCDCCGKKFLSLNITPYGNLCAPCVITKDLVYCSYCEKYHHRADFEGTDACKSCRSEMEECYLCKRRKYKKNLVEFHEGFWICKDHVSDQTHCSCCAEERPTVNKNLRDEDRDANTTYIALCGECLIEKRYGIIKRYHYKPVGKFHRGNNISYIPGELYFGVENEISFPEDCKQRTLACGIMQHLDKDEDFYYMKSDTSIPNGYEIVTHPGTFEYFKTQFPIGNLFNQTLPARLVSTVKCGMHIHMSKDAFSNAQLYRFLQFVYANGDFISTIAERAANNYCEKIKQEGLVDLAKEKSGGARAQVNLQPDYTIELRMFKGATKAEQFMKNIEFAYALYQFSKTFLLKHMTVDRFGEFVQKTPTLYPNLIAFLKKQSII